MVKVKMVKIDFGCGHLLTIVYKLKFIFIVVEFDNVFSILTNDHRDHYDHVGQSFLYACVRTLLIMKQETNAKVRYCTFSCDSDSVISVMVGAEILC